MARREGDIKGWDVQNHTPASEIPNDPQRGGTGCSLVGRAWESDILGQEDGRSKTDRKGRP